MRNTLNSNDSQSNLFNTVSKLWNKKKSKVLPKEDNLEKLANDFNNFFTDKTENICSEFPESSSSDLQFEMSDTASSIMSDSTKLHSFRPSTVTELKDTEHHDHENII